MDIASASGVLFTLMLTERRIAIYGKLRHVKEFYSLDDLKKLLFCPNFFINADLYYVSDTYYPINNYTFQTAHFVNF